MKNKDGTQIDKLNEVMKKLMILLLATSLFACTKEEVTNIVNPANPTTLQNDPADQVSGTVNGGGGKGVACTKDGKTTIEILDLYEARILYGLTIDMKLKSEAEAVEKLARLVARHFDTPGTVDPNEYVELLKTQIKKITLNKIKFISAGKKLKLTNDSFEPLVEDNCKMVQVANYYDESALLVDKALWDKMDWTNKAALMAHEIFYYMHRQRGGSSSIVSRKFVGHLLSTAGAKPQSFGMPSDLQKIATCYMGQGDVFTDYYAYAFETKAKHNYNLDEEEVEGVELVFTRFPGQPTLFRTSIFLNHTKLSQVMDSSLIHGRTEVPLRVDTYEPGGTAVVISWNAQKKFNLAIRDDATNTVSTVYTVSCSRFTGGGSDVVIDPGPPTPINPSNPSEPTPEPILPTEPSTPSAPSAP